MKYYFECKCGNKEIINFPMGKVGKVNCNKCGKEMYQNYSSSIIIPDYMKAGEEEDTTEWVKNRLASTRFSGKDKILY